MRRPPARSLSEGELLAYPLIARRDLQNILFHGPAMQGIERVDGLAERADRRLGRHRAGPAEWLEQPVQKRLADGSARDRLGLSTRRSLVP